MKVSMLLAVALGGSMGAVSRFIVGAFFPSLFMSWPTFFVNILGCFLIGASWNLFSGHGHELVKVMIMVGFLGSFTTFSTYGLAIVKMLESQDVLKAIGYIFISHVFGLLAVWAGLKLSI